MSDDAEGIEWKWQEFVEYSKDIKELDSKKGKIDLANIALTLARDFPQSKYIVNSKERVRQYRDIRVKLAEIVDGHFETIESAVTTYFFAEHRYAGLDEHLFDIGCFRKNIGAQMGAICQVTNGTSTTRYFVKTHQNGPSEKNLKSKNLPDAKEIFIYNLLHRIGIGPEPRFIVPLDSVTSTIYIATKDCQLTLLSDLTEKTANMKALLQLDLISRILCLQDCTSNPSNCGQVGDKPMIIDFRIETQQTGYLKSDLLDRFYAGNDEFNHVGLMGTAVKTTDQETLCVVRESLGEWNLLEKIKDSELKISEWIRKYIGRVQVENDLERYVQDIKATVNTLLERIE